MRFRAATTGLLLLAGLTGCSDPKQIKTPLAAEYPVRSDFLVTKTPGASAQKWYDPGYPPLVRLGTSLDVRNKLTAEEFDRVRREEPALDIAAVTTKAGEARDKALPTAVADGEQQVLLAEVGKTILDTRDLSSAARAEYVRGLTALFGTPSEPKIEESNDAIKAAVSELKLDPKTLHAGRTLYASYCTNCHGETGNGAGPGGKYLIPLPRDYRKGIFKFISADPAKLSHTPKPRRSDLYQTIHKGLAGAPMPAFTALTPDQLNNIISYVFFLSIRGETEFYAMKDIILANEEDITDALKEQFKAILPRWVASEKNPIVPVEDLTPLAESYFVDAEFTDKKKVDFFESVLRGYYIFKGKEPSGADKPAPETPVAQKDGDAKDKGPMTAAPAAVQGCTTCHVGYGKNAPYQYDEWGSLVRPRNLTIAMLRAGRRPSDIYNRLHGGIHGSGMPSHYDLFKQSPDDKVRGMSKMWDVVHFVQVMSETNRRKAFKERFNIDLDAD